MIDKEHPLSVTRQAQLLGISRGSVYYVPVPVSDADLELMREIDKLHLERPFAGARMLRDLLKGKGYRVGRRHVGRLMGLMVLRHSIARRKVPRPIPRTRSIPTFCELVIDRPNQVWAADITYIPMRHGFLYLVAVLDLFSRKVLSWRLSNSLTTDFCIDAVEAAIAMYGCPQIFKRILDSAG